jgi:hypothetical protein
MDATTFGNMATNLIRPVSEDRRHFVSQDQYYEWRRLSVFDALKGLRYGQSFCNTFDVTDNLLFYARDWAEADCRIRTLYLEKSSTH